VTRYLIDSNIFIEAKNVHYGFDFCPAFWDWWIEQNNAGKVVSIQQIADELKAKEDELTRWVGKQGTKFFLPPDESVYQAFNRVELWVKESGYTSDAVKEFLEGADCWLVAHALAYKDIVVTHEIPSDSKKEIKIPTACKNFEQRSMSPYEMLRREGAQFILGPNRTKAVA